MKLSKKLTAFLFLGALLAVGKVEAGATNAVTECSGSGKTYIEVWVSWNGGSEKIHNVVLNCGDTIDKFKKEFFPVGTIYDGHKITDLMIFFEKKEGSGNTSSTETGFVVSEDLSTFKLAGYQDSLQALLGENVFSGLPSLYNDATNLFIGVNLNEWISHASSFNIGDTFEIINGASSSLPGFIVGVSPIEFSSSHGWTTANLYTGSAKVFAAIGVGVVPEPSSIILLLIGLASLTRFIPALVSRKRM